MTFWGSYARAAQVSDLQFYEDYPYRYTTDVSRRHRWTRGETWQIASWLLMCGARPLWLDPGQFDLSVIQMEGSMIFWRSLVTHAQIPFLFLAWLMLLHPRFWTIVVAGAVLLQHC